MSGGHRRQWARNPCVHTLWPGPTLVSRFRSAHHCAAHSFANFGIKGTLAIYDSSAVFGFEVPTQTRGYNDRNFKSTALGADSISTLHDARRTRGDVVLATFRIDFLLICATELSFAANVPKQGACRSSTLGKRR